MAQKSSAATIKQILHQDSKAAVALDNGETLAVGENLLAKSQDGRNCAIKVESVSGTYAVVDISKCSFKDSLKIGDVLEKSLIPISDIPAKPDDSKTTEPAPTAAVALTPAASAATLIPTSPVVSVDNSWHFGTGIYYSAADTAKFDSMTATNGTATATGSINLKSQGSLGFAVQGAVMPRQSWGFLGSFNYEPGRKIDSVTVSLGGTSAAGSFTDGPKLSFLFIEVDAIYRWEKFYLQFGFNNSFPDMTGLGGTSLTTYKGGIGAFLGFGFLLNENSALQMGSRALNIQISQKSGSTIVDYGSGFLTGLEFGYNFWF